MIDLTKCMLIVLAPDGRIDYRTTGWFMTKGMPLSSIWAMNLKGSVIENRNVIIEKQVLPNVHRYEWFIFMDQDCWPHKILTEPFLDDVTADAVGCAHPSSCEQSWLLPDLFHMPICRVRGETIAKLKPPWFMFEYNDLGTKITKCDCVYFRDKLLEVGAVITRRGWAHHTSEKSWHSSV